MAARSGICKRVLTRHLRKLLSTCSRQGQINGNLMRINNSSKAELISHKPAQIPLAPPSSSSEAKDLGGAFALLLRFESCFRDGFFTSQKFDSGNSPQRGELPSLRMTLGGYSPRRSCRVLLSYRGYQGRRTSQAHRACLFAPILGLLLHLPGANLHIASRCDAYAGVLLGAIRDSEPLFAPIIV